jgi:hypothetical protein
VEFGVALFATCPYRCHGCNYRFVRAKHAGDTAPSTRSAAERQVRATRTKLRWRRKKQELMLYGVGILLFVAFLYYLIHPHDNVSGS